MQLENDYLYEEQTGLENLRIFGKYCGFEINERSDSYCTQLGLSLIHISNDRSRITYNELCRKCQHECKQSFRAVVVDCPKYLSKPVSYTHLGNYIIWIYLLHLWYRRSIVLSRIVRYDNCSW